MHAFLALALALLAPALAADRLGYEREIDATRYNQVPRLEHYVLTGELLTAQKNKGKLVTRLEQDNEIAADNVILESNVLHILRREKKDTEEQAPEALVRQRRGYNLENVRVPARYPYLPVANFNRFRRWG